MENFNAVTGGLYSTSNQMHLEKHKELFGFKSDLWAGFQQWKEKGRKIKKNAKSCKIFLVEGEEEKKQVRKARYVFSYHDTEEV